MEDFDSFNIENGQLPKIGATFSPACASKLRLTKPSENFYRRAFLAEPVTRGRLSGKQEDKF
jgi:hypothetical protein